MPAGELCQVTLAQVGAVCLLPSEGAAGGAVWISCHLLRCLPPRAGAAGKRRIPAEGRMPDTAECSRGAETARVVISLIGWGAFLWAEIFYVSLLGIARFVCRLLFPASSRGAGC